MRRRCARVVANSPPRLGEAPDEVDVLTEPQVLVEPSDPFQRAASHHEHGGRHVGDGAARADHGLGGTEVEGRACRLVPLQPAGGARAGDGHHTGRDGGHERVGEMHEQLVEPTSGGFDLGVHEGDNWTLRRPPACLSSRAGSVGLLVAQQAGAALPGRCHGARRVDRPVVDDYDLSCGTERAEGQSELGDLAPEGDDNRDIERSVRTLGAVGPGVGECAVEQATGQSLTACTLGDRRALGPFVQQPNASWSEAQEPQRGASDQDGAAVDAARAGSQRQPEAGGQRRLGRRSSSRCHPAVMPASIGSRAPVTPALSSVHSQRSIAATSSGPSRRGSKWCAASSAASASP